MDLLVEINLARFGLNELFETKGSYQKIGLGDILYEMATTVASSVSSFNGRIGAVVPQVGDYTTDLVTEGLTNLYYTTARAQSDALLVAANQSLSNLTSPTSINQDLLFGADGANDIGQSLAGRPNNIYMVSGLEIGSDTNLYRLSANVLKTDSSLTVGGDLNVNGTLTYLNTVNLDVKDSNIVINKGGNDISAIDAGITVDRTSTQGSLVFDPSKTSKWKAGLLGSEYELLSTANTTSDLAEGSNLYFTDSRAVTAVINGVNISDLADYYNSGIHVNVVYVNDNEKDIQDALTEVGASQGYSIYLSPGSFGGATVTVQDKSNLQIIGPATPSGAHQCELASGRALTISGATSTRVRLLNFQIEGLLTIDGTQGRHYFRDMDLAGGLTITNGTSNWLVFQNCSFAGPVTIDASFAGAVYFVQCDFANQIVTNNAVSVVQVVVNNCTGLNSFTLGNATLLGQNFSYTGISKINLSGTSSGADILWNTEGTGSIGSDPVGAATSNRPQNVYARGIIRSQIVDAAHFANQALGNNRHGFLRGRGTAQTPGQILTNDTLGDLTWYAYTGSGTSTVRPSNITTEMLENATSTNAGAKLIFSLAPIGSSSRQEVVSMATSGVNLSANLFFPAETYDIGASSSNRPNNVYVKNILEVGNDIILKGTSNSDLLWSTDGGGNVGAAGNYRPNDVHVKNSVVIGSDTNLYREAANSLKTDSSFVIGGGLSIKRSSTAINKTLTASECYLGVDTTASVTVTLPMANSVNEGKIYIIKDETGSANINNIRVQPQGADKLDNGSYFDIITSSESITVIGDGVSNWYII